MRYAPKFSDEQTAALVNAVIEDGRTVPDALRDARAGRLTTARFEMSASHAYKLVRAARETRAAGDLPGAVEEIGRRLLALELRELSDIERLSASGAMKPQERAVRSRAVARNTAAIKRMLGSTGSGGDRDEADDEAPGENAAVVRARQALEAERTRTYAYTDAGDGERDEGSRATPPLALATSNGA